MTQAVYPVIGRQDRLPFYLTGIGISDPEYRVAREKGLVSHQFLFTSSGAGVLTVDDKKYILRAGSVFYIAPAKPHEYHPLAGEWVTNWLVFRGQHAGELMAAMGFQGFAYMNISLPCEAPCSPVMRKSGREMTYPPWR